MVDSSGSGQFPFQSGLCTDVHPIFVKEFDHLGGQQLLQCPASGEPGRSFKDENFALAQHVAQVHIADDGVLIPTKHGVDSLGQLGTAAFVDAARIDPLDLDQFPFPERCDFTILRSPYDIIQPILHSLVTASGDLRVRTSYLDAALTLELAKRDFRAIPPVRKNGVCGDAIAGEIV